MKQVVFGRSVQGASHVRSGRECQDRWKKTILDDGSLILAVADGHGSSACPYSRTGARIAVNVFSDLVRRLVEGNREEPERLFSYLYHEGSIRIAQAIEFEWKKRVLAFHKKKRRSILLLDTGSEDLSSVYRQYGSTLLGLLFTGKYVYAYQLGDGDICFIHREGSQKLIAPEKILGVETYSLSRDNAWVKAYTVTRRLDVSDVCPAMFALSTDGFANSYMDDDAFMAALGEYLEMINAHGPDTVEENLGSWLSETSSLGSGDDITMLIAYFAQDDVTALPGMESLKPEALREDG